MKKITIAGEGLVGSLLAIILAKKGHDVLALERRPDMRKEKVSAGRSINLAISTRGIHALKEAGLADHVLSRAIPMMGRMIHPPAGPTSFQPYGKDDSEHINSISRGWLNAALMDHAERSKRVEIRFSQRVMGFDPDKRELTLKDEKTGEVGGMAAELVLACDGAGSAVRGDICRRDGARRSEEQLGHGYKELTLPAGPGGAFQLEKNALHIWPRGTYMLIALPNFEGSFTCTLFLPYKGPASFEALKTPGDVRRFFSEQFPDALALLPNVEEQFFSNPTGAMVTVKCSPWHVEDKALLLGDAAHAIVPFYGQGMNCGFEDVSVLSRLIDEGGGDWRSVFERFEAERKPNADAIADMAVENFIEMRDKVADPRFLFQKKVEKLLQAKFSGYVPRYSLVTFSRLPYTLAQKAGAAQSRILEELCSGLADPEDVDYGKAERLIDKHLRPLFQGSRAEIHS